MSLASDLTLWRQSVLAQVEAMIATAMSSIRESVRIVDVPVVLGARGVPLVVGSHVFIRLGLNGLATVLTWSVAATVAGVATAGAVTVDVQTGLTLATVASIAGTGLPALAAVSELSDQIPTGWTSVTLTDPMWLLVVATAVDGTLEVVSLTLRLAVAPR